ncbi:MAG: hypothetical protein JJ896_06695 [Rhodothermales bacterium]|nr:hypothetical protein [Rhodothermales bacterium]MBO6779324.1 hypothetical protein [Rhodothermales bacterium]
MTRANKTLTTLLASAALMLAAWAPNSAIAQSTAIQFSRPAGQTGLHVFETSKNDTTPYTPLGLYIGGAFTQQFQSLTNENSALPNIVDGVDQNAAQEIGAGFNLATANLNLGVQLADGMRVNLITYLSSRHHAEAWVKGGYLQVDRSPFDNDALDSFFELATVRVGHFEINYGDAHFRRTDNGNAMHNPFVGNYLVEAFTTEIGGEVLLQKNGLLGLVGVTGGEIKGRVERPDDRALAVYGKVGIDRMLNDDVRVRLTGSVYNTAKSVSNTLYFGDRAGSRYYNVLGGGDWSGRLNPGLRDDVQSFMINPFVSVKGFEFFGTYESANGSDKEFTQFAAEGIYRFGAEENLYAGVRYNEVSGELLGDGSDVSVDRLQIGGGWFVTGNVLLKLEYVSQNWNDYPDASVFSGGRFDGLMVEGVVAF